MKQANDIINFYLATFANITVTNHKSVNHLVR